MTGSPFVITAEFRRKAKTDEVYQIGQTAPEEIFSIPDPYDDHIRGSFT